MEKKSRIFDSIYEQKFWGKGTAEEPLSGSGSNPDNSLLYVNYIRETIETRSIKSVLDIGHGDWEMWRDYQFGGVMYTGLDLSRLITERVSKSYGNSERRFLTSDISEDHSRYSADLVISKDCLQHLSNSDVISILKVLQKFEVLILCNDIFIDFDRIEDQLRWSLAIKTRIRKFLQFENPFFARRRTNNMDIEVGDFRGVDLESEPFRDFLLNFECVSKFDFDAPVRSGLKKRVYTYVKRS